MSFLRQPDRTGTPEQQEQDLKRFQIDVQCMIENNINQYREAIRNGQDVNPTHNGSNGRPNNSANGNNAGANSSEQPRVN